MRCLAVGMLRALDLVQIGVVVGRGSAALLLISQHEDSVDVAWRNNLQSRLNARWCAGLFRETWTFLDFQLSRVPIWTHVSVRERSTHTRSVVLLRL